MKFTREQIEAAKRRVRWMRDAGALNAIEGNDILYWEEQALEAEQAIAAAEKELLVEVEDQVPSDTKAQVTRMCKINEILNRVWKRGKETSAIQNPNEVIGLDIAKSELAKCVEHWIAEEIKLRDIFSDREDDTPPHSRPEQPVMPNMNSESADAKRKADEIEAKLRAAGVKT